MNKIDKLALVAFDVAKELNHQYKLCALALNKRHQILSVGTNSYVSSHPLQQFFANKAGVADAIFLHAEIAAIINVGLAKRSLIDTLIIVRARRNPQTKHFEMGLAKPCKICTAAIKWYSIPNVYYSTDTQEIVRL